MKRRYFPFLSCILWVLLPTAALQAQWSTAKLSEGRSKIYPVVTGHKALFIGGEIQGGGYSKVVDVYNDSTQTWSALSLSFPTRDYLNAPAIANGSNVFVIQTGETPSAIIQIIDAEKETVATDTLSLARTDIALGSVGDWVCFAGGHAADVSSRVDMYQVKTQQWTTAELSEPRSLSACGTIDNKLFIAGGLSKNKPSNRVDIFDATTGKWDTASISVPRCMMTVVQVGKKLVFAGGGVPDFIFYDAVDIYDAESKTWTAGKLSQKVYANILRGAVSGTSALFTGGDIANRVDLYAAETGTWEALTAPSSHQFNPVIAKGDKVFFAGGLNNAKGQVDIFNTTTKAWTIGGKLSTVRYYVAGASVGNRLLFSGGTGNSSVVDIYTLPASGVEQVSLEAFDGTMYPNPVNEEIHLRFRSPASGRFTLLRSDGSIALTRLLDNTLQCDIPVAQLPAGVYGWQWTEEDLGRWGSGVVLLVR